jgi:hypothetical protein
VYNRNRAMFSWTKTWLARRHRLPPTSQVKPQHPASSYSNYGTLGLQRSRRSQSGARIGTKWAEITGCERVRFVILAGQEQDRPMFRIADPAPSHGPRKKRAEKQVPVHGIRHPVADSPSLSCTSGPGSRSGVPEQGSYPPVTGSHGSGIGLIRTLHPRPRQGQQEGLRSPDSVVEWDTK